METPLKPCPFCSSNAVFSPVQSEPGKYDWERGRVECVMCDARTGGTLARAVAEAAWNRRPAALALPLAEIEAFVAETRDLVEKVTFDESGRLVAGQWVGGNGGLLGRETLTAADTLRRRLDIIATLIASHHQQEGQ
ncbi:Lar family restriction alleviation protein [Pelagibacterium limicola]|uniref:Lar family restriction alleviation protein n=1 Tax=Pelagibacterium limicola TaxID=2791022 RepID=UPI0018AFFE4A|nr:Lar family restriction alleviation protein [Pelagibacterium limicola]